MKVLIVAVFLLGLEATNAEDVELRITPSGDQTKSQGEFFMLTCTAANSLDSPGLWFEDNNGRTIGITNDIYGRRVTVDGPNKLKLYFSPVKKGVDGVYTCKGRDSGGIEVTAQTKLVIYEALDCKDCELVQYPVQGTDAMIRCPITGSPPPVVSWSYKSNARDAVTQNIDFESNLRYQADTQGLKVRNMTRADDGIYVCIGEVENMGQMIRKEIEVIVSVRPQMVGLPEVLGLPVVRGEAILYCKATGIPDPTIQFYRMNRPDTIITGENIFKDQSKGTLKITHLTSDYSGQYKCVAENRAGPDYAAEATFNFQVIEPPELAEMVNTTADKGLDGNLTCYVKGKPTPTLKFLKEGQSVPYTNNAVQMSDSRITVRELPKDNLDRVGLQLLIKSTVPADGANYTCIAENTAGVYRFPGELRVRYKPEMGKTERTFYHWIGAIRNLTCLADAEPLPIIFQWFHNGWRIEFGNDTYKIYNESKASWLQITTAKGDTNQDKWIFGLYSCNASNTAGSSSAVIDVKQAVVPESPSGANISMITPTTISIEATPPREIGLGGVPLRGYQVLYKRMDDKAYLQFDFPITQKIFVKNLQPNTQYVLRVSAYNAVGASDQSIILQATTLQPRQPYPITVTSSTSSSTSYSYMLQWDVPLSGGAAILYYMVYYRPVSQDQVNVAASGQQVTSYSGPWQSVKVTSDSAVTTRAYEIQDLEIDQSYEVKIEAVNSLGTSDTPEPYFVFRTLTLPAHMLGPFGKLSTAAVVGILIGIVLILLIAIDVAFYFIKECGVLQTICVHFCAKGHTAKGRESMMEEGVRGANQSMDQSDHGDEMEMDEKAPLTPNDNKNKEFPPSSDEKNHYGEETTPSAKASPDGSPKEHHPIIA